MRRPDFPISLIVSSIVGGVNEQNSIVNKLTGEWTGDKSIAANVGEGYQREL